MNGRRILGFFLQGAGLLLMVIPPLSIVGLWFDGYGNQSVVSNPATLLGVMLIALGGVALFRRGKRLRSEEQGSDRFSSVEDSDLAGTDIRTRYALSPSSWAAVQTQQLLTQPIFALMLIGGSSALLAALYVMFEHGTENMPWLGLFLGIAALGGLGIEIGKLYRLVKSNPLLAGDLIVDFHPDLIRISSEDEEQFHNLRWSDLKTVRLTQRWLLLYPTDGPGYVIPKRAFVTDRDLQLVEAMVRRASTGK